MNQNFTFEESENYSVRETDKEEPFETLRFDGMQGETYLFFTWNITAGQDIKDIDKLFIENTIYAFTQPHTDNTYSQMLQYIGTTEPDSDGISFLKFVKPKTKTGGRKRRRTKGRRTKRRLTKRRNRRRRM
jgi:hypothetical protein